MATIAINGCDIYYEDSGGHDRPVIVLAHGLIWSTAIFRAQVEALSDRYRVICYDHRGQGRSSVPRGRSIAIETCYDDAVALIEALGVAPCHFGGLSMGGFVAMRLAARRPDLLRSCILIETSADPEPQENLGPYRRLNRIVRLLGVGPVAGRVMPIFFGRTFMTDPAREADRNLWLTRLRSNRRSIYKAVNGVIERAGVYHELPKITVPTLILAGDEDTATTPAKAQRIHQAIAGSTLVVIPRAGHTSTVEAPAAVNAALREFLVGIDNPEPDAGANEPEAATQT